jgi:hypothetical protein
MNKVPIASKLANAIRDFPRIAATGFDRSMDVQERTAICRACEHWNARGNLGLGECTICGCTRFKANFSAENCIRWGSGSFHPIGGWDHTIPTPRIAPGPPEDMIHSYYLQMPAKRLLAKPDAVGRAFTNDQHGLGDTIILTNAAARSNVHVFSYSTHVPSIAEYCPQITAEKQSPALGVWPVYSRHDIGNGHLIQRFSRLFGLSVEDKPCGKLTRRLPQISNRVILHFEPGHHVADQRLNIHARARMLYPEHKRTIEEFIRARPDLDFIQIGSVRSPRIDGADDQTGLALADSLKIIESAAWFLGIISGPMHAATAFGARCIVIVNFPPADRIFLPTLKVTGQVEEEWFYPQHVHLHQDGSGPLVPRFSGDTLRAAFAGEVYPFWSDKYLGMIHDAF